MRPGQHSLPEDAADALGRRVAVHRALGDPLRLAVIDALALSDLTPSEVESRFDVPSNLLAHHLGILESAGLVQRTRSQGDGRRRYLSVRRDALASLGLGAPTLQPHRLVFVCTRNSARSPLASALWDEVGADIPSTSAGTHPAEAVHPLAVTAAHRVGLAVHHRPQPLDGLTRDGDLVITVCDEAHEERASHESASGLHWSIPDPVRDGRPQAFTHTVELLRARVMQLAEHTSGLADGRAANEEGA